jgi:membrane associated rhomboid family serine protease
VRVAGLEKAELATGEGWRLLSALFLTRDLAELMLVGVVLGLAGRMVEERLGTGRLLLLFILGGVAGEAASLTLDCAPLRVGAPFALAAVIGACVAGFPRGPRDVFAGLALCACILGLGALLLPLAWEGWNVPLDGAAGLGVSFTVGALGGLLLAPPPALSRWGAFAVLAVAAVSAFRSGLSPSPPSVAAEYYARGVAAAGTASAVDGDEALCQWELALAADPDFAPAHVRMALALRGRHRLREGRAHLEAALPLAPGDPELLGLLAEDSPRMAAVLLRNEALTPVEDLLALASTLSDEGSVRAAAALLEEACQRAGDRGDVVEAAASWLDDHGEEARARPLWRRLAARPASSPEEALRVAHALLTVGQASAAESLLTRFVGPEPVRVVAGGTPPPPHDPYDLALRLMRANARAEQGRFVEAAYDVESIGYSPHPPWEAVYLRARIYFWWARDAGAGRAQTGPRREVVAAAWTDVLRAASTPLEKALSEGFQALAVESDAVVAEARARKALELHPHGPEGLYLLGLARRAEGDEAGAASALEEAARRQPGDREAVEAVLTTGK